VSAMAKASVESLLERIGELVAERQALRSRGGSAVVLVRNRRRIAKAQWDLSRALLARYRPAHEAA
jgi:hypothetical protein